MSGDYNDGTVSINLGDNDFGSSTLLKEFSGTSFAVSHI